MSLAIHSHLVPDVITDVLSLSLMKLRRDQRGLLRPATPAIRGVDIDELGRRNINGLLQVCPCLGMNCVPIVFGSPLMILGRIGESA